MLLVLTLAAMLGGPRSDSTRVAIRAGRMIDVEHGIVLTDRTILIRGDRIEAVLGPDQPAPAGVAVIDLSHSTVLPGLVDLHSHLIGDIQSASPTAPLERSAAEDVLLGVANARKTLEAGFTTVRDVGTYRGLLDVTLKRSIERGEVIGPRMAVAGAYITKPCGGGEVVGAPTKRPIPAEFRMGVVRTPAEVRTRVRYLLEHGADFIKVIATGAVLTVGTEPGTIEVPEASIRAAVEEAARHGTYVTAHAHGAEGIKAALRAGVRSIEHGSLIDDEGIALLKAKGAWLVADIYNGDYISDVGRRDHWPAEILRKNDEKVRHDADPGHPVGDDRGRPPHALGGPDRVAGARPIRGPDRGRREPPGRYRDAGEGLVRDEGWRGGQDEQSMMVDLRS